MDVSSSKRCQGGWSEKTHQSEWMHPTGSCDCFHHCTVGSSSLTESSKQPCWVRPKGGSKFIRDPDSVKSMVCTGTGSEITSVQFNLQSGYWKKNHWRFRLLFPHRREGQLSINSVRPKPRVLTWFNNVVHLTWVIFWLRASTEIYNFISLRSLTNPSVLVGSSTPRQNEEPHLLLFSSCVTFVSANINEIFADQEAGA